MSVKIYRVFVTGLVIQDEDHDGIEHWHQEAILDSLINTDLQFRELKDDQAWPEPKKKKRRYTCSICGGRHSARYCPKRHKKPTVDPWINESETLINTLSKRGKK